MPSTPLGILTEDDWHAALQRIDHEAALLPRRVGTSDQPSRENDRTDRRVHCIMRVGKDLDDGQVFLVGTRNISPGGIALLHGTPLDDGTHVVLALEGDGGFGAIMPGTVAWSRRVGMVGFEGAVVYELGVKFDRPLNLDAHLRAA